MLTAGEIVGVPLMDEEEWSVAWVFVAGGFVASNITSSSLVGFAAMSGGLGANGSDLIAELDALGAAAAMLGKLSLDFLADLLGTWPICFLFSPLPTPG